MIGPTENQSTSD